MNHKYLILLLFIFLVFLMGSVNSTVTNIFYNNTTGTQDHALLTNLSYADSNHTGFQSSSTLNNDVATLGYITNDTGNFLKRTDTELNLSNRINIGSGHDTNYSLIVKNGVNALEALGTTNIFWETNNTKRSAFFLSNSEHLNATPTTNSRVGFYYYGNNYQGALSDTNKALSQNFRIHGDSRYNWTTTLLDIEAVNLYYTNFHTMFIMKNRVPTLTEINTTSKLFIEGNATLTGLSGTGNRPLCADSDGNIIICP